MERAEVGGYADQPVFLGVPISCGGKFWSAHHLSWDKALSPHSQVAPLTPKALSHYPNEYRGVHFGVPTTCRGKFQCVHQFW